MTARHRHHTVFMSAPTLGAWCLSHTACLSCPVWILLHSRPSPARSGAPSWTWIPEGLSRRLGPDRCPGRCRSYSAICWGHRLILHLGCVFFFFLVMPRLQMKYENKFLNSYYYFFGDIQSNLTLSTFRTQTQIAYIKLRNIFDRCIDDIHVYTD